MEPLSLFVRRAINQTRPSSKSSTFLHSSRRLPSTRSFSALRPLPPSRQRLSNQQSLRSQLDHRIPPPSSVPSRFSSSLTTSDPPSTQPNTDLAPAYQLTFTCKPCQHRSSHRVTKQGYHHGTVLITCPSCKNRHVIADHLNVFLDQKSTLEDILQRANVDGKPLSSLLKRGKLGIRQDSMVGNEGEEDIEFWEDGTETKHEKPE